MEDVTITNFVEDARFAKLVTTPSGNGVLIGGDVFMITGGKGTNAAQLFVEALRKHAPPISNAAAYEQARAKARSYLATTSGYISTEALGVGKSA